MAYARVDFPASGGLGLCCQGLHQLHPTWGEHVCWGRWGGWIVLRRIFEICQRHCWYWSRWRRNQWSARWGPARPGASMVSVELTTRSSISGESETRSCATANLKLNFDGWGFVSAVAHFSTCCKDYVIFLSSIPWKACLTSHLHGHRWSVRT